MTVQSILKSELPEIPVCDSIGRTPAHLVHSFPHLFEDLMRCAERRYTRLGLAIGDAFSARWLARTGNPYLAEMDEVATLTKRPGARVLNISYEWSCTAGIATDPDGAGMRLRRVLDWDLDGLGRNIVLARQCGTAGEWWNLTWPGFSGVITAMAPGRFAAAINQPPLRATGFTVIGDWFAARRAVFRSAALPPAHLLRQAFDECASYGDAVEMLCRIPVSAPVFYSLAGAANGEGCVIERTEEDFRLRPAPVAVANHWNEMPWPGRGRGPNSPGRQAAMEALFDDGLDGRDLGWLAPPILNRDTRLAVVANPRQGILTVQGWECAGPATRPLTLAA